MSRGNAASALLDALMGTTRNLAPAVQAQLAKVELTWRDDSICKLYLCGVCPHDLFGNTKFDLHPCKLRHSDECRAAFQKESPATRLTIERQFIQYVQQHLLTPCDRRVAQGKERVAFNQRDVNAPALVEAQLRALSEAPEVKAIDQQAAEINKNIAVLQVQIEESKKAAAGATGTPPAADAASATNGTPAAADASPPVSAPAAALQKLVEGLTLEKVNLDIKKNELLRTLRAAKEREVAQQPPPPPPTGTAAVALQAGMRVCDTCASLLRIDETEERLQDHREGKVHASFAMLREKVQQLQEAHQAAVKAGEITESQLRTPVAPYYPGSASAGAGAAAPSSAPYGRDRGPPQPYDQRYGGRGDWQGGDRGGYHGGRGYAPEPYQYGRPVAPRDPRDDYRGYDRRDDRDRRSPRRSRHSRSRSRDRHRDRSRSTSRSRKHHRRSRRSRSRSPSSSRSRSRSRDRKSSRRRSRSRSRSRERKHHKDDKDRKRSRRSRSRSRENDKGKDEKKDKSGDKPSAEKTNGEATAAPAPAAESTAAPMQTDTFSAL